MCLGLSFPLGVGVGPRIGFSGMLGRSLGLAFSEIIFPPQQLGLSLCFLFCA